MQTSIFDNKSKSIKIGVAGLALTAALAGATVVSADSYTVQSGDTLSEIASQYNVTVDEIASTNSIADVNTISVGQVLEIGSSSATAEATTTKTAAASDTSSSTTSNDGSVTITTGSYTASYSAADYDAKEEIAQRESSGSYTAQNGQYYGRYQLTISYLNGDLSDENQERTADSYVAGRYGSWSAALSFWNSNGWY